MDPLLFYKSLADATRLKVITLLVAEGELCVCELTAALDESQPKVSRHLATLRRAGLLADRRQGQWVFYRLAEQLPDWVRESLAATGRADARWLMSARAALSNCQANPSRRPGALQTA